MKRIEELGAGVLFSPRSFARPSKGSFPKSIKLAWHEATEVSTISSTTSSTSDDFDHILDPTWQHDDTLALAPKITPQPGPSPPRPGAGPVTSRGMTYTNASCDPLLQPRSAVDKFEEEDVLLNVASWRRHRKERESAKSRSYNRQRKSRSLATLATGAIPHIEECNGSVVTAPSTASTPQEEQDSASSQESATSCVSANTSTPSGNGATNSGNTSGVRYPLGSKFAVSAYLQRKARSSSSNSSSASPRKREGSDESVCLRSGKTTELRSKKRIPGNKRLCLNHTGENVLNTSAIGSNKRAFSASPRLHRFRQQLQVHQEPAGRRGVGRGTPLTRAEPRQQRQLPVAGSRSPLILYMKSQRSVSNDNLQYSFNSAQVASDIHQEWHDVHTPKKREDVKVIEKHEQKQPTQKIQKQKGRSSSMTEAPAEAQQQQSKEHERDQATPRSIADSLRTVSYSLGVLSQRHQHAYEEEEEEGEANHPGAGYRPWHRRHSKNKRAHSKSKVKNKHKKSSGGKKGNKLRKSFQKNLGLFSHTSGAQSTVSSSPSTLATHQTTDVAELRKLYIHQQRQKDLQQQDHLESTADSPRSLAAMDDHSSEDRFGHSRQLSRKGKKTIPAVSQYTKRQGDSTRDVECTSHTFRPRSSQSPQPSRKQRGARRKSGHPFGHARSKSKGGISSKIKTHGEGENSPLRNATAPPAIPSSSSSSSSTSAAATSSPSSPFASSWMISKTNETISFSTKHIKQHFSKVRQKTSTGSASSSTSPSTVARSSTSSPKIKRKLQQKAVEGHHRQHHRSRYYHHYYQKGNPQSSSSSGLHTEDISALRAVAMNRKGSINCPEGPIVAYDISHIGNCDERLLVEPEHHGSGTTLVPAAEGTAPSSLSRACSDTKEASKSSPTVVHTGAYRTPTKAKRSNKQRRKGSLGETREPVLARESTSGLRYNSDVSLEKYLVPRDDKALAKEKTQDEEKEQEQEGEENASARSTSCSGGSRTHTTPKNKHRHKQRHKHKKRVASARHDTTAITKRHSKRTSSTAEGSNTDSSISTGSGSHSTISSVSSGGANEL